MAPLRSLRTLGVAAATLLLLTACGPGVQENDEGRMIAIAGNTELIVQQYQELEGTLDWGPGGCAIATTDDGEQFLLVFPDNSSLDGDEIVMPRGERLSIGQRLTLGGVYDELEPERGDFGGIPQSCLTEQGFWPNSLQ